MRALRRVGRVKDADFGKPIIAVANSFTEFVPRHVRLAGVGRIRGTSGSSDLPLRIALLCEGGGRAEQAGLRVGDELDRDRRHHRFETSLRCEALVEAGTHQIFGEA